MNYNIHYETLYPVFYGTRTLCIPQFWREAKIILLHKKGDEVDIKKIPTNKPSLKSVQNHHKKSQ